MYVLFLGVILIGYRIFIYRDLSNRLYLNVDTRMRLTGEELCRHISTSPHPEGGRHNIALDLPEEYLLGPDCYRLFSASGELIEQSKYCKHNFPPLLKKELKKLQVSKYFFRNAVVSRHHFRLGNILFSSPGTPSYVLQICRQIDDVVTLLRGRIYASAGSVLLILLVAHLLGRLLVKRIITPVLNVVKVAKAISVKDMSARVSVRNLEAEMMYLANSFNQMLGSIERSFEYIKEFSSSIGHELKTPLAIIKGETEVALRKERQVEEYRKALRINLKEANRMIHIVEDLVFLTKLDYDPGNIQKEPFDFIKFFTELLQRVQMLASHKQINLSATIPKTSITVQGNKLHLSRLFMNIIQNAVKFTPSQGNITLTVHLEGRFVKVYISDTGPGISKDDLQKIFQRFFHKDKAKLRTGEGIGLGLSIAKSIAQFHNGHIEVKSKLGEGSTFTVSLPIVHT